MNKVTPFLTFDGRAAEAIELYCSLIKDSKVHTIQRWGPGGPVKEGNVINASFELGGQMFAAMDVDGGFPHREGFSIFVACDDQAEVDMLWEKLSEGGQTQPCGWLQDAYGISWQIIPKAMMELLGKGTPAQQQAVTAAMLQMGKIEIQGLQDAFDQAAE